MKDKTEEVVLLGEIKLTLTVSEICATVSLFYSVCLHLCVYAINELYYCGWKSNP